ncbi:TPA: hypoxanthine phosphoribosyltransferase [Candidatus Woesearchaeota archaeon]|nr:hypoxanthine phosphoribosyltransferase [Candidatus Woesearchaeota archaeon]
MILPLPSAKFPVLLGEDVIRQRINELAADIATQYSGKKITSLTVLEGASYFSRDLRERLANRGADVVNYDITAKSYVGTSSTGVVQVSGVDGEIRGADVLVIEDIIDTGRTMAAVTEQLRHAGASSVRICSLLDKPSRRLDGLRGLRPDFCAFTVDDLFVIGYGLDFNGQYRDLRDICIYR